MASAFNVPEVRKISEINAFERQAALGTIDPNGATARSDIGSRFQLRRVHFQSLLKGVHMNTIDPNEAVALIQTEAVRFATGSDDDPKTMVDPVMSQIETVLGQLGDKGPTYLKTVGGKTKLLLAATEADEPNFPHKREDPMLQRRIRFIRSIAQLLDARGAVSI